MRSLVRLSVAAATIASLGAPAAFAAANQSVTANPFSSFFSNLLSTMGSSNTTTSVQTGVGPSNQVLGQTSTALSTGTMNVIGGASNTTNISLVGF